MAFCFLLIIKIFIRLSKEASFTCIELTPVDSSIIAFIKIQKNKTKQVDFSL